MKAGKTRAPYKVRLWEVRFEVHNKLPSLPYPREVVGEVQTTPSYRMSPRVDFGGGQLSITLSGEGRFRHRELEHRLHPGQGFLHLHNDPETEYYYPPDGTEPWHFLWISFFGPASESLIADITGSYGSLFSLDLETGVVPLLNRYEDYPGSVNVLSPVQAAKLCMDLFSELVRDQDAAQKDEAPYHLVSQSQELIRRSVFSGHSIQDVADELNVSREHLSRCFRKLTGETPQSYQFREKINYARHMLQTSTISCKELGYALGYDNPCSFSRAFANAVGMSPSAFRRSNL